MSDIDPNKKLNDKRLAIESSSMKLNLERYELRLMEIEEEKKKITENMEASIKRIAEIQNLLNGAK